jgi:hypothetical protein
LRNVVGLLLKRGKGLLGKQMEYLGMGTVLIVLKRVVRGFRGDGGKFCVLALAGAVFLIE